MEGSNYEVGDYVFIRAQVIHPQKQNRQKWEKGIWRDGYIVKTVGPSGNKPKNFQVFAVDEDVMISLDEARKLVREKKR
jgi:hypothetical protein